MNKRALLPVFLGSLLLAASCVTNDADNTGHSTPIDSTVTNGTAPATYGGNNPANYSDTTIPNSSDTGTKAVNGPGSSENTIGGTTDNNSNPNR